VSNAGYKELAAGDAEEETQRDGLDLRQNLIRSAEIIRKSGIPHEFRSLNLPEWYFGEKDKEALKPLTAGSTWQFRPFIKGNCLDPAWN
jgi:hypothetical protein